MQFTADDSTAISQLLKKRDAQEAQATQHSLSMKLNPLKFSLRTNLPFQFFIRLSKLNGLDKSSSAPAHLSAEAALWATNAKNKVLGKNKNNCSLGPVGGAAHYSSNSTLSLWSTLVHASVPGTTGKATAPSPIHCTGCIMKQGMLLLQSSV